DNTRNEVQQDLILAKSADNYNNCNNNNSTISDDVPFPFHISPSNHFDELSSSNILRLGTLNVRSIVSPTKQLNLFLVLLSHALHGIVLTETNLCSPSHRHVCSLYLSTYQFHAWFTHS